MPELFDLDLDVTCIFSVSKRLYSLHGKFLFSVEIGRGRVFAPF